MSLAGPLVNFIIAGLLVLVVGNPLALPTDPTEVFTLHFFLLQLFWLNVLVGGFNLLPVYPMDGGRVFQALLSLKMEPDRATMIAATVGQVAASIMTGIGLLYNPWLAIIGLFLFFAASAEKNRVKQAQSES